MSIYAARRNRDDVDGGFSLIELLVVIIIIGILAGIAIPIFLSQRQKGYQAADKSDLVNLANFEEIYLGDAATYGTIAAILAAEPKMQPSQGVTLSVVRFKSSNSYCLSAQHSGDPQVMYYDSAAGGIQPKSAVGCPTTTTGTPGDSVTG
jgi:type IV pilus assembly protein PilA